VSTRALDAWETADGSKRRKTTGEEMVSAVRSGTIVVDGVRETIRAGGDAHLAQSRLDAEAGDRCVLPIRVPAARDFAANPYPRP
jgi:hypothetical protein